MFEGSRVCPPIATSFGKPSGPAGNGYSSAPPNALGTYQHLLQTLMLSGLVLMAEKVAVILQPSAARAGSAVSITPANSRTSTLKIWAMLTLRKWDCKGLKRIVVGRGDFAGIPASGCLRSGRLGSRSLAAGRRWDPQEKERQRCRCVACCVASSLPTWLESMDAPSDEAQLVAWRYSW